MPGRWSRLHPKTQRCVEDGSPPPSWAVRGRRPADGVWRTGATPGLWPERVTNVRAPDELRPVEITEPDNVQVGSRQAGENSPRGGLSQEYASTLAQRNAALRRVQLGLSPTAALSPWTTRLAVLAAGLAAARAATLALLAPAFEEVAADLGLPGGRLGYTPAPPTAADLDARLDVDIARGATGLGPHLDDIRILSGDRDLRSFGSQGEQRLALLALLLAEAALLTGSAAPAARRRALRARRPPPRRAGGAARRRRPGRDHGDAPLGLPGGAGQVVEVTPGQAR